MPENGQFCGKLSTPLDAAGRADHIVFNRIGRAGRLYGNIIRCARPFGPGASPEDEKMLYRVAGAIGLAAFLIAGPLWASVTADGPKTVITKFNAALLESMQGADKLGYKGRLEKLAPVIRDSFDLPFMIRYSAGRHWRNLTDAQKKTLTGAFSDLTIATYADRFDGYSGEKFEIIAEQEARKGLKLVKTVLQKSDGERIKLDYLLRPTEKSWRIIDIFVKGRISELSTKRSEYSAALKRRGFDGLIEILTKKIGLLGQK
jgi:phospholipid transport system substrate-binding protein